MTKNTISILCWIVLFVAYRVLFVAVMIIRVMNLTTEDLGNDYVLDWDQNIILSTKAPVHIDRNVLDYNYDSKYIIAKQRLKKGDEGLIDYTIYPKSENFMDSTYFYLIDKEEDVLYGPLDSITFNNLLKEKNIIMPFVNPNLNKKTWKIQHDTISLGRFNIPFIRSIAE